MCLHLPRLTWLRHPIASPAWSTGKRVGPARLALCHASRFSSAISTADSSPPDRIRLRTCPLPAELPRHSRFDPSPDRLRRHP